MYNHYFLGVCPFGATESRFLVRYGEDKRGGILGCCNDRSAQSESLFVAPSREIHTTAFLGFSSLPRCDGFSQASCWLLLHQNKTSSQGYFLSVFSPVLRVVRLVQVMNQSSEQGFLQKPGYEGRSCPEQSGVWPSHRNDQPFLKKPSTRPGGLFMPCGEGKPCSDSSK